MKRVFFIISLSVLTLSTIAQPEQRRINKQKKEYNNSISLRAKISFPTAPPMSEDVVWRRDIYRELNLLDAANSGLYYPIEPSGNNVNLFCNIFKLIMRGPQNGGIAAYEYRMDGNENFTDSARIKPLQFLDNYHIYYEKTDRGIKLDNSDIPSAEVKGYYLKECAYYDQTTATFHRKVIALCPIMFRSDEFGDEPIKYPLFWIKYDDLAPFLAKQVIMTSNLNNAATMSVEDFFTMNKYNGKIYKTTNLLGKTLSQYCPTDSAMNAEQNKIEKELKDFENNIFGSNIDIDKQEQTEQTNKEIKEVQKNEKKERRIKKVKEHKQSSSKISVRRQRH